MTLESDVVLPTNGVLKKWTNYVGGWQERYFEIVTGNLMYYKSKADKTYGCRGSISLKNAVISPHEFDDSEFNVAVGDDLLWYMKAENPQSKLLWMRSLVRETFQNDSDYSSTSTKSHSRNPSLSSMQMASEKMEDNGQLFASRIAELEAYRTMCKEQMTTIERILEQNCTTNCPKSSVLSIKATHLALLANINHIIDLVKTGQAVIPEGFSKPPVVSAELKEPAVHIRQNTNTAPPSIANSAHSDDEATSSSTIIPMDLTSDGEEWHDADDFDRESSVESAVEAVPSRRSTPVSRAVVESDDAEENSNETPQTNRFRQDAHLSFGHYDEVKLPTSHKLFSDVDKLASEQLRYALAGVEDNVWTKFAEDGAMRMYTREVEDGGLPVDPLKAVHKVDGVTALEFMHYFFDARYKTQWDHTLDSMSVVEVPAPDTVVIHQKHKTVWPAASRESLFVSHIRRADEMKRDGAHDLYIVCNKDVNRPDVPLGSSSAVRVGLTVSMICETVIKREPENGSPLRRDDIFCNIIYVSRVHPGGWVPTAALRHVYKKEYPKFLRTFTDYVLKNVKGKPVSI